MALTATLGILAVYILVALSGMFFFWRARSAESVTYNIALDVVLPLAAIAICGYTIYKSVHPLPPSPMKYGPWVALGWLVLGVAIVLWLNVTRPERVQAFGSILGEGEAAAGPRDVEPRPVTNP